MPTSQAFEALNAVPDNWFEVGIPPPDQLLNFHIALKEPTPGLVEKTLYEVSTPGHHRYGKHLTRDELKELVRPDAKVTEAVVSWLEQTGIDNEKVLDRGEMISFHATVLQAESLFSTRFAVYQSTHREIQRIRALNYSLPADLQQYIHTVQPITRFDHVRPHRSNPVIEGLMVPPTDCNETITPDCLRTLYNIPLLSPTLHNQTFLGIAGLLQQYPRYDDLEVFANIFAEYMDKETFDWRSIKGGKLDQDSDFASGEANLDVQYGMAMAWPVPVRYYSVQQQSPLVTDPTQIQSNDTTEDFMNLMKYMIDLPDSELPSALSISYGEPEQTVERNYATAVCGMIAMLGARGVSVVFASGDSGPGERCVSNNGMDTARFQPDWPASCPFVTSVGGTKFIEPERAAVLSSGGLSDYFTRPQYQDTAVRGYLEKVGSKFRSFYNPEGRAFPDVAGQAINYSIVNKKSLIRISGTSASAPVFAAQIALVNAARIQEGMPPLGFLSPYLYGPGKHAFNDIVHGASSGCEEPYRHPIVDAGWNATKGYDFATGLGSMDFTKFYNLVMNGTSKLMPNGTVVSSKVDDNHDDDSRDDDDES
ncbi:hypothetical protein MBLNU457_7605t2 [Dothideomycetes sp. NU457]